MRANRERGEHGTENAGSCSGPNGEGITQFRRPAPDRTIGYLPNKPRGAKEFP
jgi:hypothetical protein